MQRLLLLAFLLCASLGAAPAGTVLVLPFFNQSRSENLDWISESLSQTVREALAARGILVLEREDRAEAYRRLSIRPKAALTHASVIKVAEALDATDVVYGQFDFSPGPDGVPAERGTLHIAVATLDMTRMRKGPEWVESGALEDLASLESHLAWQVLRFLDPETTPSEEEFLRERPQVRLDAMESYIRGLLAASPAQKHRYFTQAARLDERFSQPNFELGRLYWTSKDYRLAAEWFARVSAAGPRYLEASFLLGLCRYHLGDYAGAQRAFELVAASVPLNEVFNNLGAAQSRRNLPAALESFRKALEGDPADPDYHFNVGYALWKRGQFDAAAASFRAALDRNPDDAQATLMLGRCLQKAGPRLAEASSGLERVKLNYEEGAWRQLKAALAAGKSAAEH
ncbi:MAG: tetratricopeptide repeat protein [Bryobacteraceae bacterium]